MSDTLMLCQLEPPLSPFEGACCWREVMTVWAVTTVSVRHAMVSLCKRMSLG